MKRGAPAPRPPEPDAAPSDEDLMLAWQAGRTDAFDELVRRYHARLFGFLLRLTTTREQAEEAYSETLLRFLRAGPRWEPRQRFRAWLFTIARRCAVDVHRKRGRWLRLLGGLRQEEPPAPPRADLRLDGSQRAEAVDAALRLLPEEHRAAVLLRYRYDLDHEEVAAALGLSERQVRDRLSYARRRLRELLGEEAP